MVGCGRVWWAAVVFAGVVGVPGAAHAEPCEVPEAAAQLEVPKEPWGQQVLAVRQAQRLTTGGGVVVGVVDSGVDFTHPQLRGAGAGVDLTGTGVVDCAGHGTGVAGIIAARERKRSMFVGVAPGARLVSVKVAVGDDDNSDLLLANGIRAAVTAKARVVNVSAQTPVDSKVLRDAVLFAQKRDVVVVAAAGNVDPRQTGQAVPVYPAQYPGVLSVGAADREGRVSAFSDRATRVSVVAPGAAIVSTAPRASYRYDLQGTSFAAPYVAGVAALVRAAHPKLTAAQVVRRIEVTASGSKGDGSGTGMVDPLAAVSAVLPADAPAPASPAVAAARLPRADDRSRTVALAVGGGAVTVTLLLAGFAVALPHGRRRRWKPGT